MSLDEFLRRLKAHTESETDQIVFFLGAGCSIDSGIPAAGRLVSERWLPKLAKLREGDTVDPSEWAKKNLPWYSPEKPALSYGQMLQELFVNKRQIGREFESLCDPARPSPGYLILATLMYALSDHFSVALTTNFDDLLVEAINLGPGRRPFVVTHRNLAEMIQLAAGRPTIVKLHNDYRFEPLNTPEELVDLGEFSSPVGGLLQGKGLIFVGYGGNDSGVAGLLGALPNETLAHGVYWINRSKPGEALQPWLKEQNAVWIQHGNFEELMWLVKEELRLPEPSRQRVDQIYDGFSRSATATRLPQGILFESPLSSPTKIDEAEEGFLESEEGQDEFTSELRNIQQNDRLAFDITWLEAKVRQFPESIHYKMSLANTLIGQGENIERAAELYAQMDKALPGNPTIMGNRATLLTDHLNDHFTAEILYKEALDADPSNYVNLTNYAVFLSQIRHEKSRAAELFQKAIELEPNEAAAILNYANFLKAEEGNVEEAESLYRRALELEPDDDIVLGGIAVFLWTVRNEYDEAEAYFKRAVANGTSNSVVIGGYAFFLAKIRKSFSRAESFYKKALELEPHHPINLTNYALMLWTQLARPEEARVLYETAVAYNPEDANALGTYAVFLSRYDGNHDQAERCYRAAIRADRTHVLNLKNFATFLMRVRRSHGEAESLLNQALSIRPDDPDVLGARASFDATMLGNMEAARDRYSKAIDVAPQHAYNLGMYASLLFFEFGEMEEAEANFEKSIALEPNDAFILGNYAQMRSMAFRDFDRAQDLLVTALSIEQKNVMNMIFYGQLLAFELGDENRAEEFLRKAVDLEGSNPAALIALGDFLVRSRGQIDDAGKLFDRALFSSPDSAGVLADSAVFLWQHRADLTRAERFFHESLKIDPDNLNTLGNFGAFLLAQGRKPEGLSVIAQVQQNLVEARHPALALECWFYRLLYDRDIRETEGLRNIRRLLALGYRSRGWSFSSNLERAKQEGTAAIDRLSILAKVINDELDIATLYDWDSWMDLESQE